jgi:hypothetical protein
MPKAEIGKTVVQGHPGQKVHETLSQTTEIWAWAGEVAQVVECLPSEHKTQSSNPSTTKRQKKKKSSAWCYVPIIPGT